MHTQWCPCWLHILMHICMHCKSRDPWHNTNPKACRMAAFFSQDTCRKIAHQKIEARLPCTLDLRPASLTFPLGAILAMKPLTKTLKNVRNMLKTCWNNVKKLFKKPKQYVIHVLYENTRTKRIYTFFEHFLKHRRVWADFFQIFFKLVCIAFFCFLMQKRVPKKKPRNVRRGSP